MSSLILANAARILKPLLLAFSILILLRGHNEPGGGFVGGLVAAAAFALQAIAAGVPAARRALRVAPQMLLSAGLLAAAVSGFPAVVRGKPYLTSLWTGGIGTVMLFDAGVYLVVLGTVLLIVFTLAEERQ